MQRSAGTKDGSADSIYEGSTFTRFDASSCATRCYRRRRPADCQFPPRLVHPSPPACVFSSIRRDGSVALERPGGADEPSSSPQAHPRRRRERWSRRTASTTSGSIESEFEETNSRDLTDTQAECVPQRLGIKGLDRRQGLRIRIHDQMNEMSVLFDRVSSLLERQPRETTAGVTNRECLLSSRRTTCRT